MVEHHHTQMTGSALGDLDIHWVSAGQGPPLLLVHGLMWRAFSWRYVIRPLSEHFRVIAPDLPGAGRSQAATAPLTAPALSTWLIEFAKAVDVYGATCIGNSMGGYLCMRAALEDPGVFSRLVNLHSPGLPEPRLYALWAAMRIPLAARGLETVIARWPERWSHKNVHYFDESLKSLEEARMVAEPLRTPAGRRAFSSYLADTVSPHEMAKFRDALIRRKAQGESFPVPLQLVYATQDPMVPPHIGRKLHALLPDAEMVWMDNASHFAHVDAHKRFLGHALPFLQASDDR